MPDAIDLNPVQRAQVKSGIYLMDVISFIANAMGDLGKESECSIKAAKCKDIWKGEDPSTNLPRYLTPGIRSKLRGVLPKLAQDKVPTIDDIENAYLRNPANNFDLKEAVKLVKASDTLTSTEKARVVAALYLMDVISYISNSMFNLDGEPECKTSGAKCKNIWMGEDPGENIPSRIKPSAASLKKLFKLAGQGTDKLQDELEEKHLTDWNTDIDAQIAICKVSVVDTQNLHPYCPVITGVSPSKVKAEGKPVEVTISGANLPQNGKVEITPSLNATAPVVSRDGKKATLYVEVPTNAAPGKHAVVLSSDDGKFSARLADAIEVTPADVAAAPLVGTVNPSTVTPGQKVAFKVAFDKALPALKKDAKNPFGLISSDLFPGGIRIESVGADRRSAIAGEVKVPDSARDGTYKFALMNDKGEKVAEFSVDVKRKLTTWNKIDRFLQTWRVRAEVTGGGSGINKYTSLEAPASLSLRSPLLESDLAESHRPSTANLGARLSFGRRLTRPKYEGGADLTVVDYDANIHNGRDTYRLILPKLKLDAKWKPSSYVQPFATGQAGYFREQFHFPTPLFPSGSGFGYEAKLGVQSNFSLFKLAPYYRVHGRLFRSDFQSGEGTGFNYDGREIVHTGGLSLLANLHKISRWAPDIYLSGEGGVGRISTPLASAVNGQITGISTITGDITAWGLRTRLDWRTFYLSGDYQNDQVKNWLTQKTGSAGAGIRTRIGNFEARYRRIEINPGGNLDQGEASWTSPQRTLSVGAFGSRIGGGASLTVAYDAKRRAPVAPSEELKTPATATEKRGLTGKPSAMPGVKQEDIDENLFKNAMAYFNQGKFNLALALFHAMGPKKEDPAIQYNMGLCHQNMGKFQLALDAYKKGLARVSTEADKRDFAARIAECEKSALPVKETPAASAERLRNEGLNHLTQNNYAAAENTFSEALKYAPKNSELLYNYGLALSAQKKTAAAEAAFNNAIRLNPKNHEALIELGRIKLGAGDLRAALNYYQQATALNPKNPAYHNEVALISARLGMITEAIASYKTASGIDAEAYPPKTDSQLKVLFYAAQADALLSSDAKAALAAAKLAVKADRASAPAYLALASVQLKLGKNNDAAASYRTAAGLKKASNEDRATAYFELSKIELSKKNKKAAAKSYAAALKLKPELKSAEHPLKPVEKPAPAAKPVAPAEAKELDSALDALSGASGK